MCVYERESGGGGGGGERERERERDERFMHSTVLTATVTALWHKKREGKKITESGKR